MPLGSDLSGHHRTRDDPASDAAPESALDALLRAERDSAERLSRARDEAEAVRQAARAAAAARHAEAEQTLAAELATRAHAHEQALAQCDAEIRSAAATAVARYHDLPHATVRAIAWRVLVSVTALNLPDGAA